MRPKVIFFDLGGVVCRFDRGRRIAALSEACGVDPERVDSELYGSGLIGRWDLGHDTLSEIHARIRETLGFSGTVRDLQELWCRAFDPDPEVLMLVDSVRVCRTALLTDNDPLLLDAMPALFPQVTSRFNALLFSCVLRAVKPTPLAFIGALAVMGVTPGEAAFIDDRATNVAVAQELGITAIQFRDAQGLREDLDSLLQTH